MDNKKNKERADSDKKKQVVPGFTADLATYLLENDRRKERSSPDSLDGAALFSCFTANIIKEDVVFTR